MKKPYPQQTGSSLAAVLITMATVMVIVGIAAEYTTNVNRLVQRTTTLQTAVTAGDATLEQLFSNWRAICRATPTSPVPTSSLANIALPTSSQLNLPNASNFSKAGAVADLTDEYDAAYTVSNVKIVAVDGTFQPLANATTPPPQLSEWRKLVRQIRLRRPITTSHPPMSRSGP